MDKRKLQDIIESKFGPVKWDTQMGYGEGSISCSVIKNGVEVSGESCGNCTSLEALLDLATKLDVIEIKVK